MIASGGFFDAYSDRSGTTTSTGYSNRTMVIYLPVTCSNYYHTFDIEDAPDPKRRVPFYRALFDQRFPAPVRPAVTFRTVKQWAPHMGRVRIDRRLPQLSRNPT